MPKMAKNGQNDQKKINLSNDGMKMWHEEIGKVEFEEKSCKSHRPIAQIRKVTFLHLELMQRSVASILDAENSVAAEGGLGVLSVSLMV